MLQLVDMATGHWSSGRQIAIWMYASSLHNDLSNHFGSIGVWDVLGHFDTWPVGLIDVVCLTHPGSEWREDASQAAQLVLPSGLKIRRQTADDQPMTSLQRQLSKATPAAAPQPQRGFVRLIDWGGSSDDEMPRIGAHDIHCLDLNYGERAGSGRWTKPVPVPRFEFDQDEAELRAVGTIRTKHTYATRAEFVEGGEGIPVFATVADLLAFESPYGEMSRHQDLIALVEVTGHTKASHERSARSGRLAVTITDEIRLVRALYTEQPWHDSDRDIETIDEAHYWRGDVQDRRPWNATLFEQRYSIRVDSIPVHTVDLAQLRHQRAQRARLRLVLVPLLIAAVVAGVLIAQHSAGASFVQALPVGLLTAGASLAAWLLIDLRLQRLPRVDREDFIEGWGTYALKQVRARR